MIRINQKTLLKGMLSLAAISVMTGCVDDNYDLSNIDTTSRFTVDDLTIPVNLSEIVLKNVLDLNDNDLITDEDGYYALKQGGDIETGDFSIATVIVNKLNINPTTISIDATIPSIPGEIDVPAISFAASDPASYEFELNDIDESLKKLSNIKTKNAIEIGVTLTLPEALKGSGNKITFQNLKIQLPWGLITNNSNYDPESGILTIPSLPVTGGSASVSLNAYGIELGDKGTIINNHLGISGSVKIVGGQLKMTVQNVSITSPLAIIASYDVSGFEVASISGEVDYKMNNIEIAPISLNDLPDFLDGDSTKIIIAKPSITLELKNPLGRYAASNNPIKGTGRIQLTSLFKNGTEVNCTSDVFTIAGEESKFVLGSPVEGYPVTVGFNGLGNILENGNTGLPKEIGVKIQDIIFAGAVEDLPLNNMGKAEGNYSFIAPLGFGNGSKVIYESTEDGWLSEEDDQITVERLHISALCTTNLPVGVELQILPVDKKGNEIPVTENSSKFKVPAMCSGEEVKLNIEGANGPIKDLDGVIFKAIVTQNGENTQPLGPEQFIKLSELKVKVSGYFDLIDDKNK